MKSPRVWYEIPPANNLWKKKKQAKSVNEISRQKNGTGWKPEKLDLLFCVLQSIKWSLREEEAKTIVSIICETMINLEEVGTYESEVRVIFIQKLEFKIIILEWHT